MLIQFFQNFKILLFFTLIPCVAFAHDLGVQGQSWPIQEVNIKTVMIEEASRIHWKRVEEELKKQTTDWRHSLPATHLPKALENKTRYVNPSIVLTRDLWVSGKRLYRKGSIINPLKMIRPTTDLLFVNGDDPEQRTFIISMIHQHDNHLLNSLMIVMTQGDPVHWARVWHHPVYFAYPALLQRFDIERVPSLLGVEEGKHRFELCVREFRSPYPFNNLKNRLIEQL